MCGIVGAVSASAVNQLLYDALLLQQHRGQDAAGICTAQNRKFFMHKAQGMVRDVFRTRHMRALPGTLGLGQVRYPTAGDAANEEEAQPFYVNAPFGIVLVHNGNLTNAGALRRELAETDHRHTNTESDSEVLLNVLAHELARAHAAGGGALAAGHIFAAVAAVHRRVRGAYAVIALIAGHGLLAFRDPFGIRPLCIGQGEDDTLMLASESVALEGTGHRLLRDVAPGEAVFIAHKGAAQGEAQTSHIQTRQCAAHSTLHPCIFEYVYLARPDSVLDGIPVYQARLNLGEALARRVAAALPPEEIDAIIPIPESSRPSAMQLAQHLAIPYREGFVKNRYVGRTFIMPGQETRQKSVRQKLNAIASEFAGRRVLLVDDSIVRGTTSREIVQMARDAGARKVYLASAAPPVCHPNVYGIDMPTRAELVAHARTHEQICRIIGADALIYQNVADMKRAVGCINPRIPSFEASCFDGQYITGTMNEETFSTLAAARAGAGAAEKSASSSRLALPNPQQQDGE